MNDRNYTKFAAVVGVGVLLWWLSKNNVPALSGVADASPPLSGFDPMTQVFSNYPNAWSPPSLSDATIQVNIANQGLSTLSNQYIPLFGFVGIAQGQIWQ